MQQPLNPLYSRLTALQCRLNSRQAYLSTLAGELRTLEHILD